jgi:Phage tail tube protein
MAQVIGRATIKADGKVLLSDKGAKINVGGVKRKTIEGDRVHGYAEETVAPFIECEVNLAKGDSLTALGKIVGATVTFEADTGQTWVLKDAWVEDPPEATGGDGGKVKLKFVGMSCQEML